MNKLIKIFNKWGGVDVEFLQKRLDDSLHEVETLKNNLQELRSINEQLNRQLSDEERIRQNRQQQLDEKDELLENWQIKYETEIKSKDASVAECEALKKQLDDALFKISETENKLVVSQKNIELLKNEKEEVKVQLEKEARQLKDEIDAVQKKYDIACSQWKDKEARLNKEAEAVQMKMAALDSKVNTAERENAELKAEIEKNQVYAKQEEEKLRQQLEAEKRSAEEQMAELKKQIEILEQEKIQTNEIREQHEKAVLTERERLMAAKDEEINRWKKACEDQLQTHKRDEEEWTKKLELAQSELAVQKERLTKTEQDYVQSKSEQKEQQKDLQAQMETLEKALDQTRQKMEEERVVALRQIETLKQEKISAETGLRVAEQNFEKIKIAEEERYRSEVKNLQEVCDELRQALKDKDEACIKKVEASSRELNVMREKVIAMDVESKDVQRKLDQALSDNDALRDKLVSLETERVNKQRDEALLRKELAAAENEIARLKETVVASEIPSDESLLLKEKEQVDNSGDIEVTSLNDVSEQNPFETFPEQIRLALQQAGDKAYVQVTCEPFMSQSLMRTDSLIFKNGRLHGFDCVLNEQYAVAESDIAKIEPIKSPYYDEAEKFTPEIPEELEALQTKLADAIMNYRPVEIEYVDNNGVIRHFNLYWICYLPLNDESKILPNENLFQSLLNDEINPEYIVAVCAKGMSPQTFELSRIRSVRQFNAFVTNEAGIKALASGLYFAVIDEQVALAEMIYANMPSKFRDDPYVVSNYAHCCVLKGDIQKATKLYLSIEPDEEVDGRRTWKEVLEDDFEDFVNRGIEVDNFVKVVQNLSANGWNF